MKSVKKLLALLMVMTVLGSVLAVNSSAAAIRDSEKLIPSNGFHVGVVYDVNGGDPNSLTEEHFARPHQSLIFVKEPEEPVYTVLGGATREGYVFMGWSLYDEKGNLCGASLQPGETFRGWGWWTLKAVWGITYHYGVVYDVNGGDPNSLTPEHYARPHQTRTWPEDLIPVSPQFIVLGGAAREGYVFMGWRLYDESGNVYGNGDLLQPGATFAGWGWWTLKAVWGFERHIGVVYDVNGGNQLSLTPEHYARPHEIKIFPEGVIPVWPSYVVLGGATRSGYKFAGWRLIREDASIGELLQPGATFYGWGWWTLKAVWNPLLFDEFKTKDISAVL